MSPAAFLLQGDARALPLREASVQCVVTSPPYWGLRDYGLPPTVWGGAAHAHEWSETGRAHHPGQVKDGKAVTVENAIGQNAGSGQCCPCGAWRGVLGLEPTPDLYVAHLVEVFREVRRVLRDDGTCWLNLGDSYVAAPPGNARPDHTGRDFTGTRGEQAYTAGAGPRIGHRSSFRRDRRPREDEPHKRAPNLKPKDLCLIPFRVVLALQADGWWVRMDVIWSKPNPMPESVSDRPTKSHEYLFLLTKAARYYYDAPAIAEPCAMPEEARWDPGTNGLGGADRKTGKSTRRFKTPAGWNDGATTDDRVGRYKSGNSVRGGTGAQLGNADDHRARGFPWTAPPTLTRNRRSVWTITTEPYPGAHFATFPEKLVEPCILAGTKPGERVLDPFAGSGTTVAVAERLGRVGIGVELKSEYLALARRRTVQAGLL